MGKPKEKKNVRFQFNGLKIFGYQAICSAFDILAIEVYAVENEIKGYLISRGKRNREIDQGIAPFDVRVVAYNAKENKDYVFKILGARFLKPKGNNFTAQTLVPWRSKHEAPRKEEG